MRASSVLLLSLITVALGCGSDEDIKPTGTVAGKVTFKSQPLSTGRIQLYSLEQSTGAGADLGADGSYQIVDPIPVGTYVVTLSPMSSKDVPPPEDPIKALETAKSPPPPPKKAPFSNKYSDHNTSPLKTEIKEGTNSADFDLQE